MRPITDYFRPYGTLAGLRVANLRSFLVRVASEFDLPDKERATQALEPFRSACGSGYDCVYCGKSADQWDHLVEAKFGGGHQVGNLVPACKSCNHRKKPWLEHLKSLNPPDMQERERRINNYMVKRLPGYRIFRPEDLAEFEEATTQLFAAVDRVDQIITRATERFRNERRI